MSNEMRGEDTILGTALARAIESQPIRSTAFERSRVAVRMAGGGRSPLFPVLAAAAAVVLGLALGAALLGQHGPTDPGGVASSPTPSGSPSTTASPGASPTASPEGNDRIWVYFARDQLPPVGAFVTGTFEDATVEDRITSRLAELRAAQGAEVPAGATNIFGETRSSSTFGLDVTVTGDTAKVAFQLSGGWGVSGSAASQALLQQLVYTITEEPGIRKAHIVEQGKNEATIDQLVIDKPLTREDVLPYEGVKTEESVALEDDPRAATNTTTVSEPAPGFTRVAIEMKADAEVPEGFWSPRMSAQLRPNTDEAKFPGKWLLEVALPGTVDRSAVGITPGPQAGPPPRLFDSSPLRSLRIVHAQTGTTYLLALDDARPWRVSLEPGTTGTMRLIVDIGGHPQAISDSVAVYGPQPGDQVSRTFTLTGAARAFEAHVAWRIKDSGDREVATGFVTASLGTSPVWGTFTTEVKIPDNVSGVVTLEVFWPSPRDGADVGTVAIPLRVR
jgi:hypothetical protein